MSDVSVFLQLLGNVFRCLQHDSVVLENLQKKLGLRLSPQHFCASKSASLKCTCRLLPAAYVDPHKKPHRTLEEVFAVLILANISTTGFHLKPLEGGAHLSQVQVAIEDHLFVQIFSSWLCKPTVALAAWVGALRWSCRCGSWIWLGNTSLWYSGLLNVLQYFQKLHYILFMVEKWKFRSHATVLVCIPAISIPTSHSLKTCNICGIVLYHITALVVSRQRYTCATLMLFDRRLNNHLLGGRIILKMGQCFLTWIWTNFLNQSCSKKKKPFVHRKSL